MRKLITITVAASVALSLGVIDQAAADASPKAGPTRAAIN